MEKTIKKKQRQVLSKKERLAKYTRLSTRTALFQTTAQIFDLLQAYEDNNMNKSKTARERNISYQTMMRYVSKYWTDYQAYKKIEKEEAERRAMAAAVTYDAPEELTVEVIDQTIENVRAIISENLTLSMFEMKRRLTDPVERLRLSSKDIVAHVANLLPYLTFKIGEMTQAPNTLQANKDEFVKNFIETMTGYKQKSMNQ